MRAEGNNFLADRPRLHVGVWCDTVFFLVRAQRASVRLAQLRPAVQPRFWWILCLTFASTCGRAAIQTPTWQCFAVRCPTTLAMQHFGATTGTGCPHRCLPRLQEPPMQGFLSKTRLPWWYWKRQLFYVDILRGRTPCTSSKLTCRAWT